MTICYTYAYNNDKNLYINITNKCTNKCDFCIRNNSSGVGTGENLWLEREPSADEIIEELKKNNYKSYNEIVFCGFGEPTLRLDVLLSVCRYIKDNVNAKIRINTNGQANLIYKTDITPKFKNLVDIIYISLNAKNKEEYQKLCHSVYGEEAFDALLDFAEKASFHVPKVLLSVVDIMGEDDIKECRKIAEKAGVELKVRKYVEDK